MNPLCSICLETIDVDHQCQTNCNHIFCKVCLDKWFDKEKYHVQCVEQKFNTFSIKETQTELFVSEKRTCHKESKSTTDCDIKKHIFNYELF